MIEKMKFIKISTDISNLNQLLKITIKNELISLEPASELISDSDAGSVYEFDPSYDEYLTTLELIATNIDAKLEIDENNYKNYTKNEIKDILNEIQLQIKDNNYSKQKLSQEDVVAINNLKKLQLNNLLNTRYIYFGFGKINNYLLNKINLIEDLRLEYTLIHKNGNYSWILYVASKDDSYANSKILNNLFFENITIPNLDIQIIEEKYHNTLNELYTFLKINSQISHLNNYVSLIDKKTIMIGGFIREKDISRIKEIYSDFVIDYEVKNAEDVNIQTPTKLKNGWFSKPFELFVEMYSLPKYEDFDPTTILAFFYCLQFGLMFADLGQGLVLVFIGYIMGRKKYNRLAEIMIRVGISSSIFGFLFGSVFGLEDLLTPIHRLIFKTEGNLIHIMDQSVTMKLLIYAIFLGISIITLAISLNIYTNLKKKNYVEAFFGVNGFSGLSLYLYALICFVFKGLYNVYTLFIFAIIPLILIFFKHPIEHLIHNEEIKPKEGWGSFIIQNFFELFEVFLTFVSNTISYLRIGGFILSHTGMMLVVMSISSMYQGAGSVVAIVVGNIFVICLEGLIVGIQTLRLQYYEMFSRFYVGSGKEFKIYNQKIGGNL